MTRDRGVILVNVLVTLAIGTTLTVLMITSQDTLLTRNARAAAVVQAEALVSGAETSVQVALESDMATAPQTDHFGEPWAQAAQQRVDLRTGAFSIEIIDLHSRFNVNNLADGGLVTPQIFARLIRDLGLPDTVAVTISRHVAQRGRITALDEIDALNADIIVMLSPHVTALPISTDINLNTADAIVMGAVLGNPAAARQLVQTRTRAGFLTQNDLTNVGVLAAGGAGFTSKLFDVTSVAQVDGITVTLRSRIMRRTGVGIAEAVVVARRFGPSN